MTTVSVDSNKRKRPLTDKKDKVKKKKVAAKSDGVETLPVESKKSLDRKPKKEKKKKVVEQEDDLEIVPLESPKSLDKSQKKPKKDIVEECEDDLEIAPAESSSKSLDGKKSKKKDSKKNMESEKPKGKKKKEVIQEGMKKKSGKDKKKEESKTAEVTQIVAEASEVKAPAPVMGSLFGGSLPGDASSGSLFGGSLPGDVPVSAEKTAAPAEESNEWKQKPRCIKMRGLPFKVKPEEIVAFFGELKVRADMIQLAKKNAKASRTKRDGSILMPGEALITFPRPNLVTKAMNKHGEKIGGRYVELIPVMEGSVIAASGPNVQGNPSEVFVRYLPYDATTEDVMVFFLECGEVSRVKMFPDSSFPGRNKGICFVIFKDNDSVPKALAMDGTDFWGRTLQITKGSDMALKKQEKNNQLINERKDDFKKTSEKELPPSPSIWLTNLAFTVTEDEIAKFLMPHRAVTVKLMKDARTDEPNGRCLLVFSSIEEGKAAMEKNGEMISDRPARMVYAPNRTQPPGNSQVYVQYLPYTATEESLKETFKEAGNITRVKLMRDEEGDCKGFGFVTFSTEQEAHAFVSDWNGYGIGGRHIQLSMAQRQ